MSDRERLILLERRVESLHAKLQSVADRPVTHSPMLVRPARVTAQPSSVGKSFRIIFLDGTYYRQDNSAGASWSDRQLASSEWCQNIHENGAIPPNGSRIEVFFASGRWWTWWVAPTGGTTEQTYRSTGSITYSLQNPTVNQATTSSAANYSVGLTTVGSGANQYLLVANTSTHEDTLFAAASGASDLVGHLPVVFLQAGHYQISVFASLGIVRTTGADPDEARSLVASVGYLSRSALGAVQLTMMASLPIIPKSIPSWSSIDSGHQLSAYSYYLAGFRADVEVEEGFEIGVTGELQRPAGGSYGHGLYFPLSELSIRKLSP